MNEEIRDLIQTYESDWNEADLGLIKAVSAADAMLIGQPFPTAAGTEEVVSTYANFLSELTFNVKFDIQEIELSGDLGFARTQSHGTIVPKGQSPEGIEGNRESFVVKKIDGRWKFYRYIFNAGV